MYCVMRLKKLRHLCDARVLACFSWISGTCAYLYGRWLSMMSYRQSLLLSSIGAPLCYSATIRWGLSPFADHLSGIGVDYHEFALSGVMIGATALTSAGYGMWPFAAAIRVNKRFVTAARCGLSTNQILTGESLAVAARAAIQSLGYCVLGGLQNFWYDQFWLPLTSCACAVLAAVCLFIACAALTATYRKAGRYFLAINTGVLTPMMLLSGTWCDTSVLPAFLRKVICISPIWHATSFARHGGLHHLLLLGALFVLGWLVTEHSLGKALFG